MTDEFGISALLEPMRINQRNISNRIVMGPMAAASPEKTDRRQRRRSPFSNAARGAASA